VNRLVALVAMTAFIMQHFACCCSGVGGHHCEQGHSSCSHDSSAAATENDELGGTGCHVFHEHDGGCPHCGGDHESCEHQCCDHDSCGHENGAGATDDTLDGSDVPYHDSHHQHHLCIAAHVYYVSSPRAEVAQPIPAVIYGMLAMDASGFPAMEAWTTAFRSGVDPGPLVSAQAHRAILGVYRI
jgi:hypothetical protein